MTPMQPVSMVKALYPTTQWQTNNDTCSCLLDSGWDALQSNAEQLVVSQLLLLLSLTLKPCY